MRQPQTAPIVDLPGTVPASVREHHLRPEPRRDDRDHQKPGATAPHTLAGCASWCRARRHHHRCVARAHRCGVTTKTSIPVRLAPAFVHPPTPSFAARDQMASPIQWSPHPRTPGGFGHARMILLLWSESRWSRQLPSSHQRDAHAKWARHRPP